jgi:hypothetical protein
MVHGAIGLRVVGAQPNGADTTTDESPVFRLGHETDKSTDIPLWRVAERNGAHAATDEPPVGRWEDLANTPTDGDWPDVE